MFLVIGGSRWGQRKIGSSLYSERRYSCRQIFREPEMPVLKNLLGKSPSEPTGRLRNYLANEALGTKQSTIHENVINPGGSVPWHVHSVEEIIVVLEGFGECQTEHGTETFACGDVIILPEGQRHSLRNIGRVPLRHPCSSQVRLARNGWVRRRNLDNASRPGTDCPNDCRIFKPSANPGTIRCARWFFWAALTCALTLCPSAMGAHAKQAPSRQITMVVPYAAGRTA